jgi:hypothetical protein
MSCLSLVFVAFSIKSRFAQAFDKYPGDRHMVVNIVCKSLGYKLICFSLKPIATVAWPHRAAYIQDTLFLFFFNPIAVFPVTTKYM